MFAEKTEQSDSRKAHIRSRASSIGVSHPGALEIVPLRAFSAKSLDHLEGRGVGSGNVRAEQQTKIVEEELAEPVWVLQRRKNHLRHPVKDGIPRFRKGIEGFRFSAFRHRQ